MELSKQHWGSRVGLVFAMAGNAVGLGNFLRFPIQAIQNGGGAFIIPYLVCFLVMGIPLLWIEWAMGRFGGKYGYHATPFMFEKMSGGSKFWKYVGVLGIFCTLSVATYYCFIESWTLSYIFKSAFQLFTGMSQADIALYFNKYIDLKTKFFGIPFESLFFFIVCVGLNIWILSKDINKGIEKVALIGMPLLILFAGFLAYKGLTIGNSGAYEGCTDCNGFLALNFLFEPQYSSLLDPKVWLAAAGQVFFTLAVGMGSIHTYASFMKQNDDVALNALSAGWMNEFVEVVLGSLIIIPIACGYLGLEWVMKNAGFAMAFQTMPFLFTKWGTLLGSIGGVCWFGLLFFAGITSSLAMLTPFVSFTMDEFRWSKVKGVLWVGALVLLFGLPCVFFYSKGVLDEYDYWAGTVSLFLLALLETILFGWVFGMKNGWEEISRGSDVKLSKLFIPIIKYLTPTLLLLIFLGTVFNPENNDYKKALSEKWEFDKNSIVGRLQNKAKAFNRSWFAEFQESEVEGMVSKIGPIGEDYYYIKISKINYDTGEMLEVKKYIFHYKAKLLVSENDFVKPGTRLVHGHFVNDIIYTDLSRILLLILLLVLIGMIWRASFIRKKQSKIE